MVGDRKGKRIATQLPNEKTRKKPTLNSVKGDYIIPQDIRVKYDLDSILTFEARSWSSVEKLVDNYFMNSFTWEETGKTVYKTLLKGLLNLSKSNEKAAIRKYAGNVHDYLRQLSVYGNFTSYYKLKERDATAKREKLLARLEGDISGAILSKLGAKRVVEEEETNQESHQRRRIDELFDDQEEDEFFRDQEENSINTPASFFDEYEASDDAAGYIQLEQDKKFFNLQAPDVNLVSPHRPLVTKSNLIELKSMFDICLSSNSETCTEKLKQLFDEYQEQQRNNFSLKEMKNSLELLAYIFSLENDLNFPRELFKNDFTDDFCMFIKFSALDFILNTQRSVPYQPGEERSFYCEVIIPLFKSFGNCAKKISFKWCEKKINNLKYLWIINNHFDKEDVKSHLLDGIGELNNILPYLLIESSGFNKDEDINLTLGDSLKNLKSSSDTLKYFISNFKNASFKTVQEVHLFSVQIIQNKITLIQYSLSENVTWQVVECRGAVIPTLFSDFKLYVKIYELFAFLYLDIENQNEVYKKLVNENLGLVPLRKQETIGFALSEHA